MMLKTFSRRGVGSIVLNDDAIPLEIYNAMVIDASEESGNGNPKLEVHKVRRVLPEVRAQGFGRKRRSVR